MSSLHEDRRIDSDCCRVKTKKPKLCHPKPKDNEFLKLGKGLPSDKLFPDELLLTSTKDLLRLDTEEKGKWGNYGELDGVQDFKESLSHFYSENTGETVSSDLFLPCCGVSGGLDIIFKLFAKEGDQIVVEEPSYYEMHSFIKEYKLEVSSIPSTDQGIDVSELERRLETGEICPSFLYVIPDFSNPRGITIPRENREKLVSLAFKFKFLLISDEVYRFLYFREENKPPLPLVLYVTEKHLSQVRDPLTGPYGGVISLSSVSKIVMPSLRVGWMMCSNPSLMKLLKERAVESSGGLFSFYNTGIISKSIDNGQLDKRLASLRSLYQERCQSLLLGLERLSVFFSDKARYPRFGKIQYHCPVGGYFVWLQFPSWVEDTSMLNERAIESFYFSVLPGEAASFSKGAGKSSLRLCFVLYEPHLYLEGINNLQRLLQLEYQLQFMH